MEKPRSELLPAEYERVIYSCYEDVETLAWERVRFLEAFGSIPSGSEFQRVLVDLRSGHFYVRGDDADAVDLGQVGAGYQQVGRVRLVFRGGGPYLVKTG